MSSIASEEARTAEHSDLDRVGKAIIMLRKRPSRAERICYLHGGHEFANDAIP